MNKLERNGVATVKFDRVHKRELCMFSILVLRFKARRGGNGLVEVLCLSVRTEFRFYF